MLKLLRDWRTRGASRLDRALDGKIDHPGAAIMDAAWPKIADAVMSPVLGPQLGDLAELIPRDENARSLGSSYGEGWYGYVDKDLRTAARPPRQRAVPDPLLRTGRACRPAARHCGRRSTRRARSSRAHRDRTRTPGGRTRPASGSCSSPGVLGARHKMRWTNRPTFQQVIYFRAHRE